jgi:catalase (peroxidase I)
LYLGEEVPSEELIWQDPIPQQITKWLITNLKNHHFQAD